MDSLSYSNIDELLKTSKQLQDKLRQELKRQAISLPAPSRDEHIDLPPVWNRTLLKPYVKNVVSDQLTKGLESQISLASSKPLFMPHKASATTGTQLTKGLESQISLVSSKPLFMPHKASATTGTRLTKGLESQISLASSKPLFMPHKASATIGTQVSLRGSLSRESLFSKAKEPIRPKKALISDKEIHPMRRKPVVPKQIGNKSHLESHILPVKPQLNKFPYQRFIGSSSEIVDFSKEHPHLELDFSPNQTTLFPPRLIKGAKEPILTDVNVAVTKIKTKPNADAKCETWSAVLQKNPVIEKSQRFQTLKKSKTIVDSFAGISESPNEEPKGLVITKPVNGLFRLENPKERLSKRKKCKSQHFPVMYIRPERQIQQLPSISIVGVDVYAANQDSAPNVKYVECIHDWEKPKEVTNPSISLHRGPVVEIPGRDDNKFFKALEESFNLKECLSSERRTRSLSTAFKMPTDSFSKLSSSQDTQQSDTSVKKDEADNDVENIIDGILTASPQRCEVYVQTDRQRSIATSPIPEFELSTLPKVPEDKAISPRQTVVQSTEEHSVEDDFITAIFERIQRDTSAAIQLFKSRYQTAREDNRQLKSPSTDDKCQEPQVPTQTHHVPTSDTPISDSEVESSTPSYHSPPRKDRKEQQRRPIPLKMPKSNADRSKQERHNYPTHAEIKRAVNMFLNTLTIQESQHADVESNVLTRPPTLTRCPRTTKHEPTRSRLFMSLSSSSSSSLDFEDDDFELNDSDSHRPVSNDIAASHSDGEVLSLGEV